MNPAAVSNILPTRTDFPVVFYQILGVMVSNLLPAIILTNRADYLNPLV